MASEEVFALIDALSRAASSLEDSRWRVRSCTIGLDEVGLSVRAVGEARDGCEALAALLHRLASDVASQEAWRETTLRRAGDVFGFFAVSAAVTGGPPLPQSPHHAVRRGSEENAATDDTARLLLGDFDPGQVAVTGVGVGHSVEAAQSMAERISRIPDTATPIRIERFELPGGETHTDVYIAGTDDWSVGAGSSPFDMESNLALVAGVGAASVAATSQAMRLAGVKPGDSVSFFGHSQGGAVAVTLAESGVYATRGVVTVGSPTGTLPVRGSYPALTIEHTNDVVPALGGHRLPTNATVVRVDSGHHPGDFLGAHSRHSYRDTAARIDSSVAPGLATTIAPSVPEGTSGTVRLFRANRLPDQQPPE